MTNDKTFSAIIPTFNSSSALSRSIESVLRQSYPPLEILVVDDGSTDATRELVRAYGDQVRYFALPHSGCAGVARNRGIAESRGNYLAFLDADDAWYSNKLEEMTRSINARPDAGLFYSNFNFVDDDFRFLQPARCESLSGYVYMRLLMSTPIATSSVVVKKECFSRCGSFSEELAAAGSEDWEMWIRVSREFPFVYLPLALCEYTRHKSTQSLGSTENWVKSQMHVVEKVLADDPNLTTREKNCVRASAHYREGRFRMSRGQDKMAQSCFGRSIQQNYLGWRSWLLFIYLRINSVLPLPNAWCKRLGLSVDSSQDITQQHPN